MGRQGPANRPGPAVSFGAHSLASLAPFGRVRKVLRPTGTAGSASAVSRRRPADAAAFGGVPSQPEKLPATTRGATFRALVRLSRRRVSTRSRREVGRFGGHTRTGAPGGGRGQSGTPCATARAGRTAGCPARPRHHVRQHVPRLAGSRPTTDAIA